jgi:hypothetical protein
MATQKTCSAEGARRLDFPASTGRGRSLPCGRSARQEAALFPCERRPALPAVGSSGGTMAAAERSAAAYFLTSGAARQAAALLPLQAATCAADGRIQRRRSGGGGKERGGRPALPAVGSSGGAGRRPSFLCEYDPHYRRSDPAAAQWRRREGARRPTRATGGRIQRRRSGGEATKGPFCVAGAPCSGCLWRRQTAAPNARAAWHL